MIFLLTVVVRSWKRGDIDGWWKLTLRTLNDNAPPLLPAELTLYTENGNESVEFKIVLIHMAFSIEERRCTC